MSKKTLMWISVIIVIFILLAVAVGVIGSLLEDEPTINPNPDPPAQDIIIPGASDTPTTPVVPPEDDKKIKIYIDPGHGYGDPGTVYTMPDGSILKEMDITLELSKKVVEKLEAMGFEVRISHNSNDKAENPDKSSSNKMTLEYRYNDANSWDADLFLSIHVNSYPASSSASGIRSFYAASKRATFKEASKQFCNLLNEFAIANVGECKNSVASVDYAVLKYTDMLSSLFEIGFITNPTDRENMQDSIWLDKMADGLAQGIWAFTQTDVFKNIK